MFEDGPLDWRYIYDTTPIQQRGWVLQERELAPRTLHFCEGIILWECKTSKASSELPWVETNSSYSEPDLLWNSPADAEASDGSFDSPLYRALDISPTSKALGRRHYWFSIVESYSRKQLSRESDRLPALDGLAQASRHSLEEQYLVGMWRADMPSALLWQIDLEPKRPNSCSCDLRSNNIPCWSWASAGFGVTYGSQKSWQAHHVQDPEQRLLRDCNFRQLSIREASVSQENGHSTSPVLGGSLHCLGLVYHLPLGEIKEQYPRKDQFFSICANNGRVIGILYPDTAADRFEDKFVYFNPVRSEISGLQEVQMPSNISSILHTINYVEGPMSMGIGMVLAPGSTQRHRRIGMLRFVSETALEAKEVEDFEIV